MFPKNLDWTEIKNYNKYEIGADDKGNCYFRNKKTKRVLKPILQRSGYYVLHLHNNIVYIHKIIANQYLDNKCNYTVVDHKDGNRGNNRIDNLEWVTTSMNNTNKLYKGIETFELPEFVNKLETYQARKLHSFSNYYYGDNKLFRELRPGRYEQLLPTVKTSTDKKYKNSYYSLVSTQSEHVYIPIAFITKLCENDYKKRNNIL